MIGKTKATLMESISVSSEPLEIKSESFARKLFHPRQFLQTYILVVFMGGAAVFYDLYQTGTFLIFMMRSAVRYLKVSHVH